MFFSLLTKHDDVRGGHVVGRTMTKTGNQKSEAKRPTKFGSPSLATTTAVICNIVEGGTITDQKRLNKIWFTFSSQCCWQMGN